MIRLAALLFLLPVFCCSPLLAQQNVVIDSVVYENGSGYKLVRTDTPEAWKLYKSNNSGKSWQEVMHQVRYKGNDAKRFFDSVGGMQMLRAAWVHFANDSNGIIFGSNHYYTYDFFILHTSDGGKTWELVERYFPPRQNPYPDKSFHFDLNNRKIIHFSDAKNGLFYIGTSDHGFAFLRTTNGGRTWNYITLPNTYGLHINSMNFSDRLNGEIVLYKMNVKSDKKLVTTDGGKTWRYE